MKLFFGLTWMEHVFIFEGLSPAFIYHSSKMLVPHKFSSFKFQISNLNLVAKQWNYQSDHINLLCQKGTTQDEMAGWTDGREWTLGVGDGQGGLAHCNSWGHKESDMTERLNWTEDSPVWFPLCSFGVLSRSLLHLRQIWILCCFVKVTAAAAAKLLQLCPTLCNPIDGSPPGFPAPGILQARTLEWVAISFPMHESEKWKGSRSVVSDS